MIITPKEYIIDDKKEKLIFKFILILLLVFEAAILISVIAKSHFALIYFTFILGLLFIKKPEWGIYFLIFSLPFFTNIPGGRYHIYFIDMLVMLICLSWIFTLLKKPIVRLSKSPLDLWIFIFFFFGIISIFSANDHLIFEAKRLGSFPKFFQAAFLSQTFEWIYPIKAAHNIFLSVLLYFFLINNINGLNQIKKMTICFLASITIVMIIGFTDYFKIISLPVSIIKNGEGNYISTRMHSILWHPNFYAQFLTIIFPIYFAIIFNSVFRPKIYHFIIAGLFVISLILTLQKASWIVFILSIFAIIIFKESKILQIINRKKFKYTVIILILFIFFIFFIGNILFAKYESSVTDELSDIFKFKNRAGLWLASLSLYKSNPIFGIGVGNFLIKYNDTFYGDHMFVKYKDMTTCNSFLHILTETGVFSSLAYLMILLISINLSLRILDITENREPQKKYILGLSGAIISIFLYSFFQYLFLIETIMLIFFILISMLAYICKDKMPDMYCFKNIEQRNLFFFIILVILIFRFLLP